MIGKNKLLFAALDNEFLLNPIEFKCLPASSRNHLVNSNIFLLSLNMSQGILPIDIIITFYGKPDIRD